MSEAEDELLQRSARPTTEEPYQQGRSAHTAFHRDHRQRGERRRCYQRFREGISRLPVHVKKTNDCARHAHTDAIIDAVSEKSGRR
jgi:hypothetical protein